MAGLSSCPEQDHVAFIAPAGYGKTEAIADEVSRSVGRVLVLTHTRAGVAALMRRFRNKQISPSRYSVHTIAGFCELFASSYWQTTKYREYQEQKVIQAESSFYYLRLYSSATQLLAMPWVQKILTSSYSMVVVDEYQDCTQIQHELVKAIALNLPLHVYGDPLQGIFYWEENQVLVDWDNLGFRKEEMDSKPWRWINSGVPELGNYIDQIRSQLLPALQGETFR